jgi:holo-[acyl-carrier protein] synthase
MACAHMPPQVSARLRMVVNLPGGKPTLELTGSALARLQSLTPPGCRPVLHLTITDDHPWAQAFVVIEAVPAAAQA